MSDLVRRPSRPEAGSHRIQLVLLDQAAHGGAELARLAALLRGRGRGAGRWPRRLVAAAGGLGRAVPSSITASTWPLVTTVPLVTRSSRTIPLAGAGTSRTTLSVSRSARFSSRRIASPGCLCQATRVASATDSGSCGTRISVLIRHLVRISAVHGGEG